MKALQAGLLFALLAVAAALPAAEPVAVRVEVQPLGAGEDGTRVAVVVRVAPEDRGRIGRNAMIRIELDGEPAPGQSPLWAVRMAEDGSARIETLWPPGEHRLELEVASPSGTERGLWVGTVRIPGVQERGTAAVGAAAVAPPSERPAPEPAAAAALAAASAPPESPSALETAPGMGEATPPPVTAAAESPAPEPAAGPLPTADDALATAAAPAAAATLPPGTAAAEPPATTPAAEPAPTAAEAPSAEPTVDAGPSASEPVTEPAAEVSTPAVAGAAAAGAALAAEASSPEAEPEPRPAPGPGPEPAAVETAPAEASAPDAPGPPPEQAAAAEQGPAAEEAPSAAGPAAAAAALAVPSPVPTSTAAPSEVVVEPLRAAGPQPAAGETAGPVEAGSPPAAAAPPAPPPAASAAGFAAWAAADPAAVELTAVVLADREPVPGLGPSDLRLRLGGAEVAIEAVGDAGTAPLLLGIAVDAAPENGLGWPGSGGPLGALAARAAEGRGRVFYAAPGLPAGEWDAGPPSAVAAAGGDLASLVAASLERLAGTRGRRFLLLVTDGRSEPDKAAWQSAVDAAASAGTPVLVVALWDERFSQRSRKQLRELAEVSGGSLFLVQGRGQLERAAERFGPLLDAGVSLRFTVPAGLSLPAELRLEAAREGLEVASSKRLR